jgi:hypothetical protein
MYDRDVDVTHPNWFKVQMGKVPEYMHAHVIGKVSEYESVHLNES